MKIRSEEEQRRICEEEDAQPYLPGFTWGEYCRLPESRQQYEAQKFFQIAASSLGYW